MAARLEGTREVRLLHVGRRCLAHAGGAAVLLTVTRTGAAAAAHAAATATGPRGAAGLGRGDALGHALGHLRVRRVGLLLRHRATCHALIEDRLAGPKRRSDDGVCRRAL